MRCERVVLNDGTVLLVGVKPGQKLTAADIAALNEFNEMCKKVKKAEGS